jgi:hypothetical protein
VRQDFVVLFLSAIDAQLLYAAPSHWKGHTCSTSLPKAKATAEDMETVVEAVSDTSHHIKLCTTKSINVDPE